MYREYTESILSSDTWSALWDCGCWHAVVLVLPWLPLHKDDILYHVVCRAATTHDVIAEGPRPKPTLQHCIMAVGFNASSQRHICVCEDMCIFQ